jgi:hypothetical protein
MPPELVAAANAPLFIQHCQATKIAFINALTDASAVVFDHQCAAAHSRMKTMTNALYDTIDEAFLAVASRCASGNGSAEVVRQDAADEVNRVLTESDPVTTAIGEALQDAVACGCKPGNCVWCVADGANRTSLSGGVSAFNLGYNISGELQRPLNWNQLAQLATLTTADALPDLETPGSAEDAAEEQYTEQSQPVTKQEKKDA